MTTWQQTVRQNELSLSKDTMPSYNQPQLKEDESCIVIKLNVSVTSHIFQLQKAGHSIKFYPKNSVSLNSYQTWTQKILCCAKVSTVWCGCIAYIVLNTQQTVLISEIPNQVMVIQITIIPYDHQLSTFISVTAAAAC